MDSHVIMAKIHSEIGESAIGEIIITVKNLEESTSILIEHIKSLEEIVDAQMKSGKRVDFLEEIKYLENSFVEIEKKMKDLRSQ